MGNVLLGDDGLGPYVIRLLESQYDFGEDVEVADLGTPALDLTHRIAGRQGVILVDCIASEDHAAVFDKEENGYKRYKVVSAEEARAVGDALIHSETIFPVPSSWPSVIGWRPGGAVYSNGTAMGFVRRAQAQAHGVHAFRKIKIT